MKNQSLIKTSNEIQDWLVSQISQYVFVDRIEIKVDVDFNSFGLSSKDAILLSGDLEEWLGLRLSPTLVYEYPTIEMLARYLEEECWKVHGEQEDQSNTLGADLTNTNVMQSDLDFSEASHQKFDEPIAVIGLGLRFPGCKDKDSFWQLLSKGKEAITPIPRDRWDFRSFESLGSSIVQKTMWGGFIEDIDMFDPQFFGISPREAEWIDPQQRLLAEVVFEAFQDSGLLSSKIKGSRTGVFIGISNSDYGRLQSGRYDEFDAYGGTGNAFSIAANRISYLFDLQGPSIAIDTACSSSLVGVHLACQSLHMGESDIGVAGGVNIILSPDLNIIFSRANMLSPDGKCKAFDAQADGYVRGEGCGIVILKRLSEAIRDDDRIYATIRATAVNQDGRTNGLTAPNVLGQQSVIRQAFKAARILPSEIKYVEAHGTGTYLGDQIEAKAIGKTYNQDRKTDDTLFIGSVKTNIGHLEAASGIASLIKVILMLQTKQIPPSLNFNQPNPQIPFEEFQLSVPTRLIEWPTDQRREVRIAGVNAFGFGGTNAHVIVSEYNETRGGLNPGEKQEDQTRPYIIPISAHSHKALVDYYSTLTNYFELTSSGRNQFDEQIGIQNIAYTASRRRDHYEYRTYVVGKNFRELIDGLKLVTRGELSNLGVSSKKGKDQKTAFLFPDYLENAKEIINELVVHVPLVRDNVKKIRELCLSTIGEPLLHAFTTSEGILNDRFSLDSFVLEICLFDLLESYGILPKVLIGEYLGILTASVVSGMITLEEGLKIFKFVKFNNIISQTDTYQLEQNGNNFSNILGTFEKLDSVLEDEMSRINPITGSIPLYSSTKGEITDKTLIPILIESNRKTINENQSPSIVKNSGVNNIVILGEYGNTPLVLEQLLNSESSVDYFHVMDTDSKSANSIMVSLLNVVGDFYRRGADINWDMVYREGGTLISIPTVSWQRDRMWLEFIKPPHYLPAETQKILPDSTGSIPLVGKKIRTALGHSIYELQLSMGDSSWLTESKNGEYITIPEPTIIEMITNTAMVDYKSRAVEIDTFTFHQTLQFNKEDHQVIQTILFPSEKTTFEFQLHSLAKSTQDIAEDKWSLVIDGTGHFSPEEELTELFALLPLTSEDRKLHIEKYLQNEIGFVLRLHEDQIPIDVPVNLFGLDSIVAVEIIHEIEKNLGIRIPISRLLEGPTIEQLVNYLISEIGDQSLFEKIYPVYGMEERNELVGNGEYPLSPGQRAMWLQHQMDPKSVFNPAQAFFVKANLDIDQIRQAFSILATRHATLRTTFHVRNGEPIQLIHEQLELSFIHEDSSGWDRSRIDEYLANEAFKEFNLESGPLIRVYLLKIDHDCQILMVIAHHLIVDLWSLAILVYELYQLISSGNNQEILPILKYQYTDYVGWQLEFLESDASDYLWEYWQRKLGGNLPILDLNTDRPRPAVQTYTGANKTVVLNGSITSELTKISQQYGVTMYMLLLAAFYVLLYRYTDQEDIVVGSPATGRTKKEFSEVIGYFVNPIPLRSNISAHEKFSVFLSQVKDIVIGALEHQEYPFPWLVEKLHPERDASILPLFQVMFAFQRSHLFYEEGLSQFAVGLDGMKMSLESLELESINIQQKYSQFDLILTMAHVGDGLGATLTYNSIIFEDDTATRILDHFSNILQGIIQDPERELAFIPILTEEELDKLIVQWNNTQTFDPLDRCVHKYIADWAAIKPDALAICFESTSVSYQELNGKANKLASYLIKKGVGPNQIIGIFMERSPELIIAILGILKAGAAYLPLDPIHPYDRLAFMLHDARVPYVVTQASLMSRLPTLIAQPIFIDSHWGIINQEPDQDPEINVAMDDLAYVIYTSGSTGRSKGVLIEHRGLTNLIIHDIKGFRVEPSSRFLQFASIGFDASVLEIFTTLVAGATLVMAKREILLSVPDLYNLLDEEKISIALLPPSLLALLPAEGLPDFKMVLSGGESCSKDIVEKWSKGRTFINAYGPTETTVAPTYFEVSDIVDIGSTVPIGKPISNTQIFILDKNMQPVPVGIRGELFIGGIGVARGYLNRPELTEEKFIPNPFFPELQTKQRWASSRLYRTGDLGRYLPDGNIEFLGRIDNQVKLRGFRIELGEIESVIDSFPGISQIVVMVREDEPGSKRLVAYLAPEPGNEIRISELRKYLREKLPEYMVPASFITLDAFPLNSSGKIDRNSLPIPSVEMSDSGVNYVSPKTDLEQTIATIWQEVLNVNRIGLNDNFFDLGGHSLLMAKAHAKLQEALNNEFSLINLFRYPTVNALAEFLSGETGEDMSNIEEATERASMQKEAMKRQADRMRLIAKNRIGSGKK